MATTSRYATPSQTTGAQNNPTSTKSAGSTSSNGTTNSTADSTSHTNSSTNSVNMDPGSLAALQGLIAQLASGGTDNMKQDRATKVTEIGTLQRDRQGYSKEAAFADAKGLMAQTMRQALEKLMPGINSGSLGAGASQSSMRALLTQKAAENAAENASAQGLTAAVNYGNVSNGISGVLERLIAQQDPAAAALINALNVAKGAVTSSTTSSDTTGSVVTNGTTTNNGTTNEAKNIGYGGNTTMDPVTPVNAPNVQFFGQQTQPEPTSAVGSTADFLNQLYGNNSNAYNNYTF